MSVVGDILPDEGVKDTIKRSGPIHARPAWSGEPSKTHREFNARHTGEWLPRPYHGRIMSTAVPNKGRQKKDRNPSVTVAAVHLIIVPGPQGLYQIVTLDLNRPLARGFRTKEQARGWIGRAVRAGVLPEGVVEIEPPAPGVSET